MTAWNTCSGSSGGLSKRSGSTLRVTPVSGSRPSAVVAEADELHPAAVEEMVDRAPRPRAGPAGPAAREEVLERGHVPLSGGRQAGTVPEPCHPVVTAVARHQGRAGADRVHDEACLVQPVLGARPGVALGDPGVLERDDGRRRAVDGGEVEGVAVGVR
ncbi:hypothetical protein GCM10010320_76330 [Streptomyces caelestis]|nr:hypothetical protein GCM10010320_76330 [Streptomyces caelestis]